METSLIETMKLAEAAGHALRRPPPMATHSRAALAHSGGQPPVPLWCSALTLIGLHVPVVARTIAAGCPVQRVGDLFTQLHLVQGGVCKSTCFGGDGHAQIVGLHFSGDWIGFDGIADARCATDAIALGNCQIWSLQYAGLLKASTRVPALARLLAAAMSDQIGRNRRWRHAQASLSAVQRVADFLRAWQTTQRERVPRADAIAVCMTRAEIGNYLALTVETVSRAFCQLERDGLIRILPRSRRHFEIPDLAMLGEFARFGASANARQALH